MKSIAIIGASGYTGAQITSLIQADEQLKIQGLYVSENSLDKGKKLASLYPVYSHIDLCLAPLTEQAKQAIVDEADAVCQQSSLARVTCSLSGVLYIILMFSPFLIQRCPLSFLSSNHPSYYCVHSMSISLSMPIIHPE